MKYKNYLKLFKPWEIRNAHNLIDESRGFFEDLRRESFGDLMHDCLTHWYFKRDQYSEFKQAKCKTFMNHVIKNKLMDISKSQQRNVRKALFSSVPIETFLIDDEDDLSGSLSVMDEGMKDMFDGERNLLLARAIKKLSRRQKELCRLIQQERRKMTEISQALNIPRGTLFDEVLRIREIFREEGLCNYM